MKNSKQTLYKKTKTPAFQTGMTLVELMIASVLSVIVIWAVSLTFARTQELNNSVANRTKMQQSVREAIDRITADAKEAGSFGCIALANNAANIKTGTTDSHTFANVVSDIVSTSGSEFHYLKNGTNMNRRYGVGLIDKSKILSNMVPGGFTATSNGLFFQFGKGSASGSAKTFTANQVDWPLFSENDTDLFIAANCSTIQWIKVDTVTSSGGSITIETNVDAPADAIIMKYVGHLYVVGEHQGIKGLYMLTATNDVEKWKIDLVSPYITDLNDLRYGYAMLSASDACTTDTPIASAITYIFSDNPNTALSDIAPMSVVFDLSAKFMDYKPNQKTSEITSDNEGDTIDYEWITAMVREGNVCANRTASQ